MTWPILLVYLPNVHVTTGDGFPKTLHSSFSFSPSTTVIVSGNLGNGLAINQTQHNI